ncbi:MAG TPA: aminoacyl-tRNA hydrolase [Acidimicrobiales bacterium]|jgi:PTH1 family peptidyl-tRNA hydrolase|nr:aminoacyl-tRNA hydrolase [Acidimicrobiales bacterium]|tara:strand:+ start:544 stop:1170 length:627 start_codon:yes stop_codon:yes gene_type:complete
MSRLVRGERLSLTRRGESAELLVVGLGNPGSKYAGTRHNVGREVIDELVKRKNSSLKAGKEQALVSEIRHNEKLIVFAIPMNFMNDSGISVAKLMRRYRLSEVEKLLIVHDELDLEVGAIRLKEGGGLAGHNGLRSVKQHIKNQDFRRIRIGIGKPFPNQKGAQYVLSKPGKKESQELLLSVINAADSVESILETDFDNAMQIFNKKT